MIKGQVTLDINSEQIALISPGVSWFSDLFLLNVRDFHIELPLKLEYCFAKEKEIVFALQKQSVPMSINDFVEMTIVLCLIWFFSICAKMQGFVDDFLDEELASRLCRYPEGKKFCQNRCISLCC